MQSHFGMNKEVLKLAIPNIISNISVPLLSTVDIILMGNQAEQSTQLLGALAIATAIFNLLYWGFSFLRLGTTGLTAQAFGAKDFSAIQKNLGQAVFVAIVVATGLLLLQFPLKEMGIWAMGATADTADIARQYFDIRIWAAPAVLLLYVFNGWFFGMQNARYPMFITIGVNIANIGFNYYFVKKLGMQADGVALGTVLAQYTGLILAIGFLFYNYRHYLEGIWQKLQLNFQSFQRFFALNTDIFIRTLCLIITFTYFTKASAAEGEIILAMNTILLQLFYMMAYAVDGFAFSSESMVGKYKGAKNLSLLKKSVHYNFMWGMGFALLFALFFAFGGKWVISQLTDSVEVISASSDYMFWIVLIVLTGSPAFIWDGIYVGATASAAMRNNMLLATFIAFFPVYFILYPFIGNHALWAAMNVYMLARSIGLSLTAKRHIYT